MKLKKILSTIIAAAMILGLVPMYTLTASAVTVSANDTTTLQNAINDADDGVPTTIEITNDFTVEARIEIPENKIITIKSDSGETYTLTRGIEGHLITVRGAYGDLASFTLENIIIDGDKNGDFNDSGDGSLVCVFGEFEMKNGAILQNNIGGGVFLTSVAWDGGNRSGTFVMNGGKIINNDSTGVSVGSGEFNMYNGEISGNIGPIGYFSAGVRVSNGIFTMYGGKINNNIGYGVSSNIGTFAMYGGEIKGNTDIGVYIAGNGVNIYGTDRTATFTLGGTAKIIDNTASFNTVFNGYITLGTGANAPTSGMEVGIKKSEDDGVFVESGATEDDVQYFFADEDGATIEHDNGRLKIVSGNTGGVGIPCSGGCGYDMDGTVYSLVDGTTCTYVLICENCDYEDGPYTLHRGDINNISAWTVKTGFPCVLVLDCIHGCVDGVEEIIGCWYIDPNRIETDGDWFIHRGICRMWGMCNLCDQGWIIGNCIGRGTVDNGVCTECGGYYGTVIYPTYCDICNEILHECTCIRCSPWCSNFDWEAVDWDDVKDGTTCIIEVLCDDCGRVSNFSNCSIKGKIVWGDYQVGYSDWRDAFYCFKDGICIDCDGEFIYGDVCRERGTISSVDHICTECGYDWWDGYSCRSGCDDFEWVRDEDYPCRLDLLCTDCGYGGWGTLWLCSYEEQRNGCYVKERCINADGCGYESEYRRCYDGGFVNWNGFDGICGSCGEEYDGWCWWVNGEECIVIEWSKREYGYGCYDIGTCTVCDMTVYKDTCDIDWSGCRFYCSVCDVAWAMSGCNVDWNEWEVVYDVCFSTGACTKCNREQSGSCWGRGTIEWNNEGNIQACTACNYVHRRVIDTSNNNTGGGSGSGGGGGGGGGGSSAPSATTALPSASQTAISNAVSADNGTEVKVTMGASNGLSASDLNSIKGKDVNLVLDFGNYTIEINGKDIPADLTGALNLSVTQSTATTAMTGSGIPSAAIREEAQNLPIQQLRIGAGAAVNISGSATVKIGEQHEGKNAILASYNEETGKFEFVSGGTIDKNGNATVNFNSTGSYVVIVQQTGDITGTGEIEVDDALEVLKHMAGLKTLDAREQFIANGGKNADIDIDDALNILRLIAGLVDKI